MPGQRAQRTVGCLQLSGACCAVRHALDNMRASFHGGGFLSANSSKAARTCAEHLLCCQRLQRVLGSLQSRSEERVRNLGPVEEINQRRTNARYRALFLGGMMWVGCNWRGLSWVV